MSSSGWLRVDGDAAMSSSSPSSLSINEEMDASNIDVDHNGAAGGDGGGGGGGRSRGRKKMSALEVGNCYDDDNEDDEFHDAEDLRLGIDDDDGSEYDDFNDSDEYTSSDGDDDQYAPSLGQHPSGRTTLLSSPWVPHCCRRTTIWRSRERTRCIVLCVAFVASVVVYVISRGGGGMMGGIFFGGGGRAQPPMVGVVMHPAYDVVHTSHLIEYNGRMTLYKHRRTGAEFLSYVPDTGGDEGGTGGRGGYDPKPDKVFGVAFRTKPESSTGVPHILEHSVLCGSKKYPSRDPFAQLLKGSLQTFLNAMTYPDRTVYPVASRNRADFNNLMDVYLDAVFHPRAVEEEGWWVLRQEGWRYEEVVAEDDDDDAEDGGGRRRERLLKNEFEYKGVVYSEMKGAYSDPEDKLERLTQSLLFPDNPYFYDSGGDPAIIPTLTREEFVSFYKKYYHPTNARVFVAGDEKDVYHALASLDRYIAPMGYNPASRDDSVINYQQLKFKEPVRDRRPFVAASDGAGGGDDDEGGGSSGDGHMICVTWLLNSKSMSAMMELAWIVLDGLLLGRPSSPLRKALEDSRLGEEIIGGGLSNELLQSTFAIGMKGVKTIDDVASLETLITDTLHTLYLDGFNDDEIASTMNTIEFQLREGGGGLRGMEIFLGALTKWNYDLSPKDALVYEDALKMMKTEIETRGSKVFKSMISDSLLGNSHRVVMELYPSTTLEEEQKEDTKQQISEAQSKMTDAEYQRIIDEGIKLKELQSTAETPEVIASNPALSLSDIDPTPIEYPIHVEENPFNSGIRMISHEVVSSGIAYIDIGLDISMIPYESLSLLPSLITLLNEAGTKELSDAEFRNYVGKVTGGVSATLEIISVKPTGWDDKSKVLPGVNMLTMLFINGKCTSDKIQDLFDVFKMVLMDINFEDSQSILQNALKSSLSSKKSNVASRGHSYVNTRIRGRYSVRSFIDEKMYGVSSLESYTTTLEAIESDWQTFVVRLIDLREAILKGSPGGKLINLTGDKAVLDLIMEKAEEFITNVLLHSIDPESETIDFRNYDHPWVDAAYEDMKISSPVWDEGIAVATQVAYTGEGVRLYDVGEPVKGSASVVSHYLTTGYMWDVIRAKNGAYGAWSQFSSSDGIITLYTYRDPNPPSTTLDAFHDAPDELLKDASSSTLTRDDNAAITTAVIGTIGDLDGSALSAHEAGWVALIRYLRGESAVSRQRWRKEVMETTLDDFIDFAHRLQFRTTPSIAIVASQSALDEMERGLHFVRVQ